MHDSFYASQAYCLFLIILIIYYEIKYRIYIKIFELIN